MKCQVLKTFEGDGRLFQPGDIVNSGDWPTEAMLVERLFLQPLELSQPERVRILRHFEGMGSSYRPGQVVSTDGWRTLPALIQGRYVAPVRQCRAQTTRGGRCTKLALEGSTACEIPAHQRQQLEGEN